MPTMEELRERNEAIEQHMAEWKRQRYANGENPMDWVAFRGHVQQLGAADPGEAAPDEFYRWDDGMHGGQPDATSETQGRNPAEPHAFGGLAVSEVNSLKGGPNAGGDTATMPPEAGSGGKTSHWPRPKTER